MAEPGRFFNDNALMGIHLIEAARKYSVEKTVVLGTIFAYPKFHSNALFLSKPWTGYPEKTKAPYWNR